MGPGQRRGTGGNDGDEKQSVGCDAQNRPFEGRKKILGDEGEAAGEKRKGEQPKMGPLQPFPPQDEKGRRQNERDRRIEQGEGKLPGQILARFCITGSA